MPLLHLDQIILHRTVPGPPCPACGGELEAHNVPDKPVWWKRLLRHKAVSRYICKSCGQQYQLRKR